MLGSIELASHLRLPLFGPSYFVLAFMLTNLGFSCLLVNINVYMLFAFIYGSLMLYRFHWMQRYLKVVMAINLLIIWSSWNGVVLNRAQENLIFYTLLLIFSKQLIFCLIEAIKSLCIIKPLDYEDMYWIVQFGVII